MADDILINIRTVGVEKVHEATDRIVNLTKSLDGLTGAMSASSRKILRQVEADKMLAAKKAELRRAVDKNVIKQGEMNQAMKEAHRQARLMVLTDKELIAQEKEKNRIKAEAEAKEAKHLAYVDELRRKYDAQYQQEVSLNQTKDEYNTLLQAGVINQEEFNHLLDRATAEARDFEAALAKGGNQFGRFNLEAYRSAATLKRQVNAQVQQLGYQVGDLVVQIQSGTDAFVAIGQQGSQLAGAFNRIGRFSGPMVGAFIAIGAAAGTMLSEVIRAKSGVQDLEGALDDLAKTRDNLEQFFDFLGRKPEEIADKYQMAIDKVVELQKVLAEESMAEAQRQSKTQLGFMKTGRYVSAYSGQELDDKAIAAIFGIDKPAQQSLMADFMKDTFGITLESRAFGDFQKAAFDQYREFAKKYREAVDPVAREEAYRGMGQVISGLGVELPEEFKTAGSELAEIALSYDESMRVLEKVNARANGMDFKTGFASALEQGVFDIDQLLPPKEVMDEIIGRVASTRAQTVQERMEQLGRNRGYMSRAAGVSGAGQASKGDVSAYTDALRIRSALETAYLQDTVAREEKSQQKINNIYKLYGKTRYESDLDAAAAAETKRQALIERNRKIIGGIEQDLADSYIEGVRKRIDEEQKLAAEKKKQEDRQKRIDDAASNANKLQMIKNNLLADELQYGKESDTYRRYAVIAAGQIAAIQARSKGVSEDLVQEARILAEQQERAKFDLADSVTHAKALARELKAAAQAMTALGNVGDSVEMALIKANAQVAALSTGGDLATAGRIAGLREENRRAMNEAIAAGGDMSGIMSEYTQTESSIDALAKALQIIADSRGKTGGGNNLAKDYKEYLDGLRNELKIAEELKDVHGEEYTLQRDLLLLKQKYGILVTAEDEVEIERAQRRIKEIEKQKALQEELADTISSSMGDAFMSIMDGTESAKDAFKDMADFIVKELFRILVMEQMVDSIKGSILGPDAKEANGGAYMGGNRLAFAKGGVVTGPTYFPMSRGRTGLMGEAGPEAIMPLERGSDGKLGVKASGGQSVVVNQSFNFSANGDDSVKRIIAQEAPKIADMTTATIMDQRRRGGAMRKAFN